MELLKINTAGSVDDGKSTLIGRFLYDSDALTIEQEELVRKKSKEKGLQDLDFSVITDGLIAEREQGITIDVAHIYFSSPTRKFIIADSPGHVEYTRNMVTGASNSEVSIILIDARKGLLEQTYRHYFISKLLQLDAIIFCVNKMDLVDYSEDVFLKIASDVEIMSREISVDNQQIVIIPVSSLKGDNIVKKSEKMPWYLGDSLSGVLHDFKKSVSLDLSFRMDIQQVYHIQNKDFIDYRSYAGRVISGEIMVGDAIVILPSGKESLVTEISQFKTKLKRAKTGDSIQIKLQDTIDVSRGMMLVKKSNDFLFKKEIQATLVWMDDSEANLTSKYTIQAGTRTAFCKIKTIHHLINPLKPSQVLNGTSLQLNDIGKTTIQLANPIFLDAYSFNKNNGAFILIDNNTNNTVAVGFVE